NLHLQCESANVTYEILVLDDASTDKKVVEGNSKINSLVNCSFNVLSENIGRSKIRNLLAEKAQYNWLLFMDADTFPTNLKFISNYLEGIPKGASVIYGGTKYPDNTSINVN